MTALIIAILIMAATALGLYAARDEGDVVPVGAAAWARAIAYWLCTVILAFEMVAGGMWDLGHIEYVRRVLAHLGYPEYLLLIIGVPRVPCALAILAPRFGRLKEWAYAGAVFTYLGAAASHALVGDPAGKWATPLVVCGITFLSWALRPASRRVGDGVTQSVRGVVAWGAPVAIASAMAVVAMVAMPK